ncbi:MAG: HAD family hydrolase [Alphaproteobacteria bacterium]
MARRPRIETLVLDLDGTLIDSVPDLGDAVNAVLLAEGLAPVGARELRRFVGEGAQRMVEQAVDYRGGAIDRGAIERHMQVFRDAYRQCCTRKTHLYKDVAETLRQLAGDGYRLALCTNKPTEPSLAILKACRIDSLFAAVICGDTFAVRKPDPLCVTEAIARSGGRIEAAAMIGDSRHDVKAAHAARVPAIVVSYGYSDVPVESLGADAIIGGFGELPHALRTLA